MVLARDNDVEFRDARSRGMADRFYTFTLRYGQKEAIIYLIDVDCKDHKFTWYDPDEPANAIPALDLYGKPVVAPGGETYRLSKSQLNPPPSGWMHEFCDTDWTVERRAASR
jgi:hypothetical protein